MKQVDDQKLFQIEFRSQANQLVEMINRDQDWGGKATEQLSAIYQKLSEQSSQELTGPGSLKQAISQYKAAQDVAFEIDGCRQIARLSFSRRQKCHQCEAGRRLKVWRYGPFSLRAENNTRCSLHGPSRSWSYSVVARLGTFLSKSLEFTLGGLWGAGEWSIGPSLRLRNILERSQSPLFRAFDGIMRNECWRKTYINDSAYAMGLGSWDTALLEPEIDNLVSRLREETDTGRLRDYDEWGNTFLFVSDLVPPRRRSLLVPFGENSSISF